MKIPELAEELNITSQELMDWMWQNKLYVNTHTPLNNEQIKLARSAFVVHDESEKLDSSERNDAKRYNDFRKTLDLAKKGNREAQYTMGTISEGNQRYDQAYDWYKRAAKQGYGKAYYFMARLLETGRLNPGYNVYDSDLKKALTYYAIAAVLGSSDGQKKLADFYYHGNGVEQNFQNAIEWYENASNRNNEEAQCALGQIYTLQGEYELAYKYFLASANNHYNVAQYELGLLLLKGQGVRADEQDAIHWLGLSMEQNYTPAMLKLAEIYKNQETTEGYKQAFKFYLKASSFSAEAERNIAEFHYYGYGNLNKDVERAFEWYQKSADHGDAVAQYMVAGIYCVGNAEIGVRRDYNRAAVYFKRAADQNHAVAAYNLAMLYKQRIISSTPDYIKAYPYFLIAAENGHTEGMFETAEILWNGLNGDKDINTSISWYAKCALKGNQSAQKKLLDINRFGTNGSKNYSEVIRIASLNPICDTMPAQVAAGEVLRLGGFGIKRDYEASYNWYRKAANQGSVEAAYWLADYFRYGKGIQKNESAALIWYEKAAKEDYLEAIVSLGFMYGNGIGTSDGKPDYDKAVSYNRRGVSKGSSTAHNNLAFNYYYGRGVEKDLVKAFDLFYTAAQDADRTTSQKMVAEMYENGTGVKQDLAAAFLWYSKAADHKDIDSAYKVGYMLTQGIGTSKDLSKALPYYRIAADTGHIQANDEIGNAYLYGLGTKVDYKTAYKYVSFAAKKKIHRSEYNLGVMYQKGLGLEKSDKLAEEWFLLAADGGHKVAQYQMGCIYGNRKEYDSAFKYYSLSASQKYAEAQNMCGRYYDEGWGSLKKDHTKANEYFLLAAEQGYDSGLWNLGINYYCGAGTGKDYTKAFHYIFLAAEKGHKLSCNKVAEMYELGQGVEKNIDEALRWYTKASSSPHFMAKAQLSLGKLYLTDALSDYKNAVIWLKKAQSNSNSEVTVEASNLLGDLFFYGAHVEQNYADAFKYYNVCSDKANAQTQTNLAEMYFQGLGTSRNVEQAIYWYQKALAQDDTLVEASWRMGEMYLKGTGTDQNCEKAEELLAVAADSNHIEACYLLGVMILENKCKKHDLGQAVVYLEKAADAGVVDAMFRVGMIYFTGQLVHQDYSRAFQHLLGASSRGHVDAMLMISDMYAKGNGVDKDKKLAKTWLVNAAENGNEEAIKRTSGLLFKLFS